MVSGVTSQLPGSVLVAVGGFMLIFGVTAVTLRSHSLGFRLNREPYLSSKTFRSGPWVAVVGAVLVVIGIVLMLMIK